MHPLTFQILLTLKEEPQHAEGIVRGIESLSGGPEPPLASFYRSLKKAIDDGAIEIVETRSDARRGRPPQRYRITSAGRAALSSEARRLAKLAALALGATETR